VVIVTFLEARGDRWEGRGCSARPRGGIEAVLSKLGCSASDFDGRGAEGEGLGLHNLANRGILHFVALACFGGRVRVGVHGVAWGWAPAAGARRERTKAGGVGRRLRAELREVEI